MEVAQRLLYTFIAVHDERMLDRLERTLVGQNVLAAHIRGIELAVPCDPVAV